MKTSKFFSPIVVSFVLVLLLSACGSAQTEGQPVDKSAVEPVSEPMVEPTVEQAPEPTTEPTPVPEIDPKIVDLGHDAKLLVRGLPEDVILDVSIELEMKENVPDSRYFDNVHSEIALVRITKNGEPATLDKGVAELCYTTTLTPGMEEQPVPFFWDTSNDPLLDGRPLRVSNVEKEPDLVVCSMIETCGAYGLIAR
jgi:hypothetical protein